MHQSVQRAGSGSGHILLGTRTVTRSAWLAIVAVGALVLGGLSAGPAFAANTSPTVSAAFSSDGVGAIAVGDVLYAKQGGALKLVVTTSSDVQCVSVVGTSP